VSTPVLITVPPCAPYPLPEQESGVVWELAGIDKLTARSVESRSFNMAVGPPNANVSSILEGSLG
jgi:hypothetical protein